MPIKKTPGVYIVEKNAFPNSVVEVETAVPAFIGYTQKAEYKGRSLINKPTKITSMAEFHEYFGFAPNPQFSIEDAMDDTPAERKFSVIANQPTQNQYALNQSNKRFLLYYSMLLFYQNGGSPCYIVSAGHYLDQDDKEVDLDADKLIAGIKTLIKESEPTLLVIPETVSLSEAKSIKVQKAMLTHCGDKMKNRFAILDIWQGYKKRNDPSGDCVENFRSHIGTDSLSYGAAYYPWVDTTIVQDSDLSYEQIDSLGLLKDLITQEITALGDSIEKYQKTLDDIDRDWTKPIEGKVLKKEEVENKKKSLNKSLIAISPLFNRILKIIKKSLNQLPPAAAMAGLYTMVDNTRGVWKAPANISMASVVSPTVTITNDEQEDLNITPQGKSINAIRSFVGEGTLVWGARTLDGNSLDWRYISVRRTLIMLEESIILACKAYVFEANDANTWITIKNMISNFLTGIWKRGGLAGASPDDAFSVHVGLGETMTAVDILDGILKVTVLVAVTRPAEFIEITFQQQMQKS